MKADSNIQPGPDPDLGEQTDGISLAANLRQALEHVNDPDWLKEHSPLESVMTSLVAGAAPARITPPVTGVRSQDEVLQAICHDWESRHKTGLQALLWSTVLQVPSGKDLNYPALLMLTYFQYPRPRQADLIKQLAVGQSTYYRQLNAAVQALESALISHLRPSLRLEWPTVKPLVGRDQLTLDLMAALREGSFVNLVGASGLGKTSVGAAIAHAWSAQTSASAKPSSIGHGQTHITGRSAFWYTFRPGLTDNLQQLIYAIALFLHELGASSLWLHLTTKPEDLGPVKIMAMIHKSLEDLHSICLPLFCFDEVDLLLPHDLDDNQQHVQLLAWLEEFVKLPRSGSPVLFIGQRLVLEPEPGRLFTLNPFGIAEVQSLAQQSTLNMQDSDYRAVLNYTHGNPLLVHLLLTLQRIGEPLISNSSYTAPAASLDWFLARLRRHLTTKELDLLDAISVFGLPAPADIWRKQSKALNRLIQLQLVERSVSGLITVATVLRGAWYRQLPADVRAGLHVSTARACAERGAFTLAVHHFVLGQQPEMAVWMWYKHRDQEIRQGQAQTALHNLEPLRLVPLADEKDRRALSLALSELYYLLGRHGDGLEVLETGDWQPHRLSSSRARELRARLLAMRGDIDAALAEYRASLDALDSLSPAKAITLRTELAQQALWRARDTTIARREALLAQQDTEMLLGDIDVEAGHTDSALAHYQVAMELAQQQDDPVRLAKVNEAMGILEARRLNVDAARQHLEQASLYYTAYGNLICAIGVTRTNMAYAFLLARRYPEAVAPAAEAIAFFTDVNQPYWLSLNEANLAEAHANLGNTQIAEEFAWRALTREEVTVRPYCLYVLGHVRRLQAQYAAAEQFCKDALESAESNGDVWAAGPAWRVLGEVYRDWGRLDDARTAFTEALHLYVKLHVPQEGNRLADLIRQLGTSA